MSRAELLEAASMKLAQAVLLFAKQARDGLRRRPES